MALTRRTPKPQGNGNNTPIANLLEGDHECRLVYVADLGLQEGMTWKNEDPKPDTQQLSLGVEVIGETVTLTVDDEEVTKARVLFTKPFNVFHDMTKKGKELEFYRVFDSSATEDTTPDWAAQLGKPCSATVFHTTKEDVTYDNVSALTAIPAKYHDGVGAATLEMGEGDVDDPDNFVNKALFGLPKYVFDKRISEPSSASVDKDEPPKATADTDEDPFD